MADEDLPEATAEIRRVSDLQKAFIGSLQLDETSRLLLLLTVSWGEYAGRLAESTKPVRLEAGNLTVAARTGAFAQELSLQSRSILERIRRDFSGIQKLSIVQSR